MVKDEKESPCPAAITLKRRGRGRNRVSKTGGVRSERWISPSSNKKEKGILTPITGKPERFMASPCRKAENLSSRSEGQKPKEGGVFYGLKGIREKRVGHANPQRQRRRGATREDDQTEGRTKTSDPKGFRKRGIENFAQSI